MLSVIVQLLRCLEICCGYYCFYQHETQLTVPLFAEQFSEVPCDQRQQLNYLLLLLFILFYYYYYYYYLGQHPYSWNSEVGTAALSLSLLSVY